jgi:hypothetical protein
LESADLILWHACLLPSPQRSTSSNSGGISASRDRQISDKPPILKISDSPGFSGKVSTY